MSAAVFSWLYDYFCSEQSDTSREFLLAVSPVPFDVGRFHGAPGFGTW
jgi:hypothetical protein